MNLPEYISVAEVQRVCAELHIRDWTQLQETVIEAKAVLANRQMARLPQSAPQAGGR